MSQVSGKTAGPDCQESGPPNIQIVDLNFAAILCLGLMRVRGEKRYRMSTTAQPFDHIVDAKRSRGNIRCKILRDRQNLHLPGD